MQPRVHLLPSDPAQPRDAAFRVTSAELLVLPRRRPVTIVAVGFSPVPALSVAPWTLRGVDDAVAASGRTRTPFGLLGNADVAPPLLGGGWLRDDRLEGERRAVGRGERRVPLQVPAARRRARVPKAWIGTSLLLVTPLLHRRLAADRPFVGPTASAFAALAEHCGLDGSDDALVRAGLRLVSDVFVGSLVVVDATWWAATEPGQPHAPCSELVAPEHVMSIHGLGDAGDLQDVDGWLSVLLGLDSSWRGSPPRIAGKRRAWPQARLPNVRRLGMAGRAVEALFAARRRAVPRTHALGPTVPGRFSTVWTNREDAHP